MNTVMTFREVDRRIGDVKRKMHAEPYSRGLVEHDKFLYDVLQAIANGTHEGTAAHIASVALSVYGQTEEAI